MLLRFVVRRDMARMLAWVGGFVLLAALSAASVKGLYPTQADLDEAAAAARDNVAAIAFNGPAVGLDTVGGQVAFNLGAFGLVMMGLMSLLMVGRLTRGEEETGRLEMLRALPVGARAPTAAAVLAVGLMNVVAGGAVTACLVVLALPVAGSVTFGASFVLFGLLLSAIAMAVAETTENTRVVYGSTGAVLAAAFVLRAIGDTGDGTVSWLSPIGWAQKARPYAGDRWWPFGLLVAATVAVAALAGRLGARRDYGAGLVAPRPGRANATRHLRGTLGLAVRLQRGSLVGWGLGTVVMAVAYGAIAPSIDQFVRTNQALADMFAAGGGSLTDAYLATSAQVLALIGTGYALQSVLRLRSEEASLHAEALLATPTSRLRWALSHLALAFGGVLVLLALTGVTLGASYSLAGGPPGATYRALATLVLYAPAVWVMAGLGVALVGLARRATIGAWLALSVCLVIGFVGPLLRLPQWALDLSPFTHVPRLPGEGPRLLPVLLLIATASALTAAGLAGLRHRDVG